MRQYTCAYILIYGRSPSERGVVNLTDTGALSKVPPGEFSAKQDGRGLQTAVSKSTLDFLLHFCLRKKKKEKKRSSPNSNPYPLSFIKATVHHSTVLVPEMALN